MCLHTAHRHGWHKNDLGNLVQLPDGEFAELTLQMVDSGLDEVTHWLTTGSAGHHYQVDDPPLERLAPGSHGVWATRSKAVMAYKLLEAAKRCKLAVLLYDVGQKSRRVQRPAPSHRLTGQFD